MNNSNIENHQSIEEKFFLIFKYMGIPKEQIRSEISLKHDFFFNDFQFNCLAFYIGLYFKINLREEDYAEIKTIGETIDFVKRKLNAIL